jgi:phosphoglycolate phosphatase-like HAD superfamily hydrolase
MRPTFELVILDFDGTFTRVDDEAKPFLAEYRAGLEALLGAPIDEPWEDARARIAADPDRYGWEYEERIVAPSHADPYILATSIAQLLLRERGLRGGEARPAILEELFRAAYAKATTVFREDAREVIEHVLALGVPAYVVTNSRTVDVERKIAALGARESERLRIRGEAQKWVIAEPARPDRRFMGLPAELRIEGLARSILLRRGRYFDALASIWEETGATAERTLVCGDIYELDLALPARIGAAIHMVGRPSTPAYERAAVRAADGTFSEQLGGLLTRFG